MNRGSLEHIKPGFLQAWHPSMRPRFMNRGSVAIPILISSLLEPSMRPRFMNRGSLATIPQPGYLLATFNEAPIHESGK